MKYLRLFENYKVDKGDYPKDAHDLSNREKQILEDLVGDSYLKFNIKKEDGYYYTKSSGYYNKFDNFNDLKDYLLFHYFIDMKNIDGFLELLKSTDLDPSFDNNLPIRWASMNRHSEILRFLLKDKRVDPSVDNNYAIRCACGGDIEMVKLLLQDPRVDPSDERNTCFRIAIMDNNVEIAKLLLKDPRVDPSYEGNSAIREASTSGKIEIVKLLLKDPRVDPSDLDNHAIKWAKTRGHKEIVKLLLKDKRVRKKLGLKVFLY